MVPMPSYPKARLVSIEAWLETSTLMPGSIETGLESTKVRRRTLAQVFGFIEARS